MNDLVTAAFGYLSAGLSVIALSGKAPNARFHPEGLNTPLRGTIDTDDDLALLNELFEHPSTTGIGIPIPSHMVVVDIDGEDGAAAWKEIVGEEHFAPDTAIARTGRGLHLWFSSPKNHRSATIAYKLDLKGQGGYVAAPPSRHPDTGREYAWIDELVVDGRVNVEFLPEPMEAKLKELAKVIESKNEYHPGLDMELDPKTGRFRLVPLPPDLSGLRRAIIEAPDGNQNNIIAWAALTARDEGVPFETAMEELLSAAIEGNHPRNRAITAIKGAYKRARRV